MRDPFVADNLPRLGLDQISTRWPLIEDPVKFVMRYAPAMQGYLNIFLKDPHDVQDVCQAFLLRMIQRGMVEERALHGRFRDYLIASVRNAALNHLRSRSKGAGDVALLAEIPCADEVKFPADEEWVAHWRRCMLAGVWEALENHQQAHPGNLSHTVLRALVNHPDEDSVQLAARVSTQCGRAVQPEAFRKQVSRARRLFAEFLVQEVSHTLGSPTPVQVEEELIDLGLMKYVQAFLPSDWRSSGKLLDAQ